MYRRPYELAKVKHVACVEHRAAAQTMWGQTEAQVEALNLGREKGTNHRTGYKHREESKRKTSVSHKQFHAENPEFAKERGKKTQGEQHYRWKGGVSKLNLSIRQMTENRRWMDSVKSRDGLCIRCGSKWRLEAHHKIGLAELIKRHNIKSREDAQNTPELWDINNGETICELCHYKEHDRRFTLKIGTDIFAKMPPHLQALFSKLPNPERDEVIEVFPGGAKPKTERTGLRGGSSWHGQETIGSPDGVGRWPADEGGSAARFFYSAKADDSDRSHGKETIHPTVKPLDLMRYLVRLVCAKGGIVLDPFMGSGSTGCACIEEGMYFIGIEKSEEYAKIAVDRMKEILGVHPIVERLKSGKRIIKDTPPPPKRMS